MDTWLDLLQSTDLELNRGTPSDLYTTLVQFTKDRIRYFQRMFFWATPVEQVIPCVVGQSLYSLPETIVSVSIIQLQNGNNWQPMARVSYESLLAADTNIPPTLSVPALWAPWDGLIRIFQTPDRDYPMKWVGNGRIPIPDRDDRVNFWTREAADLIRCSTLAHLFLRRIKNFDQYKAYALAAEEYRQGLMSETIQRTTDKVIAANW